MTVLPIRIHGDPVLHEQALPVTAFDERLRTLVADMFETMDAAPGVGLAGPQVGVGQRLFVYSYRDDEGSPWRGVVINPTLYMTPTPAGAPDDDEDSEGCLSFPGERFPLRRSENVIVTGVDLDGQPVRIEADGWRARILQHEYDHLDGTIYIDRLDSAFDRVLLRIVKKRGWNVPGNSWNPMDERLEG
ncbi:peptide deformylase [Paramicrobacterium chengjingii]|uniref:Peptide deformylase n=1 Tax=Paramicrobacterium chengjingii TaxID=2769067 RepID=A0ABX6YMQ6_9MICO|nr:peptide deformylase [Microbacterium chengjingii]QPZ40079.1 peptide deformylase [Microbacterium chengjingii]